MDDTLFDRIGGEDTISDAVDLFYRKVLRDDRIARFFDDVDMEAQAGTQRDFLVFVLGGPGQYSGLQMAEAHAELVERGFSDYHFDVVEELLGDALLALDISPDLIGEVTAIAESVRDDVLGRTLVTARPASS